MFDHDQTFVVQHAYHVYIDHPVHNHVMHVRWDGNIVALIACMFQIPTADE